MFIRIVLLAALWPAVAFGQTCSYAPFHWEATTLDAAFEGAGQRFRIDPDLGRAMSWVESRVTATAVSPKGAKGLMQLMPSTSVAMRVSDPLNPHQSIYGGMEYLHQLISAPRFAGNLFMALVAYNAGPNHTVFPPGSYDYANTVIAVYWRLKAEPKHGPLSISMYLRVPRCGRTAHPNMTHVVLMGGKVVPSRHYRGP